MITLTPPELEVGIYVLLAQGGHVPGQRPRTVVARCECLNRVAGDLMVLVQIVDSEGRPKYRDKWVPREKILHVFTRRMGGAPPSRSNVKTARDWLPRAAE